MTGQFGTMALTGLRFVGIAMLMFSASGMLGKEEFVALRWAVAVVGLYGAAYSISAKRLGWAVGFAALSAVFNPIAKLQITREMWIALDIAGVAFLAASFVWLKGLAQK